MTQPCTGQTVDEEILTFEAMEKKYIGLALRKFSGNYSQSAKALGISLSTFKRKLKAYNL
jgi:transcriptional regulator of acetoin/glycerol metabolism